MPSKIIFDSETEDMNTVEDDSGAAAEATPAKKIKKTKDGKKLKIKLEVEEEQPDCEPPAPKKKKKDKRAADQTSDGAIDMNGNCNGVNTTPKENENADPDTEETEKKKKKKKKKSTETDEASPPKTNGETADGGSPQTNGHSTPTTPTQTPSTTPAQTPSQSSDDSDIETEKSTETPEQKAGAFSNFNLSQSTISKLKARGISYLFDIQVKTFQAVSIGKDVIGQARTGTGKTFAFAIPLVEKLQNDATPMSRGRPPKVLVLTPTRELAIQVHKDFKDITKNLSLTCFYGGSSYNPQMDAIRGGIDILVGTPGRIKDHLQNNKLDLSQLKHVVLDEVDQMLDMGFADQVEEILSFAYKKDADTNPQTLLFSATCPAWVYNVAKKYMKPGYMHVDLIGSKMTRAATTVEHLAIACHWSQRASVLGDVVQVYSGSNGKTIIFCETKKEADELSMNPAIKQSCASLHGDIVQKQREITLKGFRKGTFEVLVATNVAARGLDIPEVDLVIQCSPPQDVESYIHRSGRTGRAGRTGVCICFYQRKEEEQLRYVEHKAGLTFRRVGVPTANEIMKSSSDDALKCLDSVSAATIALFKETAEKLIEERGAVEALSAALAHISGATNLEQRSLLNSENGYTTLKMECSQEMHSLSYAWRSLKEQLGEEIEQHIHRMCVLKDQKGVCFDVPSDKVKEMQDGWKDGRRWQLSVCTELPDLVQREHSGGGGRGFRGNGGGGRSFGGGGRGGGGFRGGRGRNGGRDRSGGFRGGQKRSFSSAFDR